MLEVGSPGGTHAIDQRQSVCAEGAYAAGPKPQPANTSPDLGGTRHQPHTSG